MPACRPTDSGIARAQLLAPLKWQLLAAGGPFVLAALALSWRRVSHLEITANLKAYRLGGLRPIARDFSEQLNLVLHFTTGP